MKNQSINRILQETHDIYNAIASDFSITRGKWWHALDDFGKYVKAGDSILDLGCGNGRLAELFVDKDISYLGLDQSEELIKIAREKFKDYKNIKFEMGDVTYLALPSKSFDVIFMLAVLHHLPSRDLRLAVLKEANKLLSSGGRMVISNWNIFRIRKYRSRMMDFRYKLSRGVWSIKDAFIPWKPIGKMSQRYVHSFTKGEMRRLLHEVGFEIEDLYYENKGSRTNFFQGYNLIAIARKK